MPYALIPEGFTLKKVTQLQEDAVKEHRRHEDVKTFLGNETTPVLLGATALYALTPMLLALFFKLLEEQGVTVDKVKKEGVKAGLVAFGPVGWTILAGEKALGRDVLTDDKARFKFIKDYKKVLGDLFK